MAGERADAVTIRRFAAADANGLVALWSDVLADRSPWNEPRSVLERKVAHDPELVFVAATGERIVGSVMGGYDGVRGWIYSLGVAPTARRQGIATRLMQAVEAALAARGCPKINLQVRATNAGVVEFYRTLGYEVEDRLSLGKRV